MAKPRPCVVPCCQGEKFELVHKFPSDRSRAELWTRILNIPELANLDLDTIRGRYFVCSRHFRDSDYKNKLSRSLNVTANPSLNLIELCDVEGLNRIIPPMGRPMVTGLAESSINSKTISLKVHPITQEKEEDKDMLQCEYDPLMDTTQEMANSLVEDRQLCQPQQHQVEYIDIVPRSSDVCQKRVYEASNMAGGTPAKFFRIGQNYNKLVKVEPVSDKQPSSLDSVILRKVKLVSPQKKLLTVRNATKLKVENVSTETQTDFSGLTETQKAATEEPKDTDAQENANEQEKQTTRVLALLECTPENLQKLKLKMNDGAVLFDEKLFQDTEKDAAKNAIQQSAIDDRQFLTLRRSDSDESIRVSYIWLRDHCRCRQCYNHETFHRSFSILDVPDDVCPSSYEIRDGALNIIWKDDHVSSYDLDFIFNSQFQVFKESLLFEHSQPVLWDQALISESPDYCRVSFNELLCDDEIVKRLLKSLITFGVAFIEKVPTNPQSTEMAVRRMFPVHKTLFGEMFTFSDTKDYLGPHTDNFYSNDAAGLRVVHCIQLNATGGETILIDGLKAVEQLRHRNPEVFERLCNYPVTGEYLEEGKHHTCCAPIIKRHIITGEVEQLRFNVYDQAILKTIPQEQIPQFYADLKALKEEINGEGMAWKFPLTPGTVMIFDNWRVLHGRHSYSGKRVMSGCYVSRAEYRSLARTLGIIS